MRLYWAIGRGFGIPGDTSAAKIYGAATSFLGTWWAVVLEMMSHSTTGAHIYG